MSNAVEYDIILKNGQFKQAAKENEDSIRDVNGAAKQSAQSMDYEFANVTEQIKFQKEIISGLEDEIKKLEQVQKNAAPGTAWSKVTTELNAVKKELAGEKSGLIELESQVNKTEEKHVSFRTQLRAVKEELIAMEAAGQRGSEGYRQLQEKAGQMQDAMSDANDQMRIMAHDQRGMQGVISGIDGISGAMAAAAGVYGLFAGENENLQRIMLKVQSLMSITIGLQQVEQTLNKDSAFRLVVLNGLKEWWAKVVSKASAAETAETATMTANTAAATANATATGATAAATTAAGTAAKTSAGGFKILSTAIKSVPGIGWIIAGVTLLTGLIAKIVKDVKKARKEASDQIAKAKEDYEQFNNSIRDSVSPTVSKVMELSSTYKQLGDNIKEKTKFVATHKEEFRKLGVEINNVRDADNLLIENTENYIKSEILKAKALGIRAKAAELVKNNIDALTSTPQPQMEVDATNPDVALYATVHNMTALDYDKLNAQNKKNIEAQLEDYYKQAADFEKEAAKLFKTTSNSTDSTGNTTKVNPEEYLIGFEANYKKIADARDKKIKEIESRRGKKDPSTGVTIDDEAINQETEVVMKDYQEELIQLQKKYGLYIEIPVEVKEDDKAREKYEALLDQYADYKRKIDNINKKYDEQIATAGSDDALKGNINKARTKEINEVTEDALKLNGGIGQLFTNVEKLGKGTKDLLLNRLQAIVDFVKKNKGNLEVATDSTAGKLGVDLEVLKTLLTDDTALSALVADLDKIDKSSALEKLIDQFKELKKAKEDYAQAGTEEEKAQATATIQNVKDELTGTTSVIVGGLSNVVKQLGGAIGDEIMSLVGELGSSIAAVLQSINDKSFNASSLIGIIVSLVVKGANIFYRVVTGAYEMQRITNKAKRDIGEINYELAGVQARLDNINRGRSDTDRQLTADKEALMRQKEEILRNLIAEELARGWRADWDALNSYYSELTGVEEDLANIWDEYYEKIVGVDGETMFGDFTDMIVSAFDAGKDSVDDFADYFNNTISDMIKNQVLNQLLADKIQKYLDDIAYQYEQGNLTGENAADYLNWMRDYGLRIAEEGRQALEALAPIFDGLTDAVEDSTLSGSIKSITAEQAGVLAGQMNAMRLNQFRQIDILSDSLRSLDNIDRNTRYIRQIFNFLRTSGGGINTGTTQRAYGIN